jgi:hypothetical protein
MKRIASSELSRSVADLAASGDRRGCITEQHPLARATERERGGEAGGPTSHDDDVIEHGVTGHPSAASFAIEKQADCEYTSIRE